MSVAPLFCLAISYFIGSLLIISAAHKFARPAQFQHSLNGYGLVPAPLVRPIGYLIGCLEAVAAIFLITGVARPAGGLIAAILFALYGAVMGYALLTGRTTMGCGCEWGDAVQPIRKWMVWRNAVLAGFAVFLSAATLSEVPNMFDISNAAAAALAVLIIYNALPTMFEVSHRITLIRKGA